MGLFDGLIPGGGSPAGAGDFSQASGNLGNASNVAGQMQGYGATSMGEWGQDNPAWRQAVLNLAQQYGQQPTEQQKAGVLGSQNADAVTTYAKAKAQLMSDAAQRGLDTAGDQGTQSSTLGGGLATLDQGLANTRATNATNYYNQYESPEARRAALGQQANLLQGLATTEYGQGTGALDSASKTYLDAASGYTNLGQQEDQAQAQQQEMWNGLINGLGGGLGTLIGNQFGGGGDSFNLEDYLKQADAATGVNGSGYAVSPSSGGTGSTYTPTPINIGGPIRAKF